MIRMKKRGISTLIATVLLVLITIAAIGIIWGAILPLIQRGLGQGKACGFETALKIDKSQGWTCFNASENTTIVMIERPLADFDLSGIVVQISGEGKKVVKTIRPTQRGIPGGGGTPGPLSMAEFSKTIKNIYQQFQGDEIWMWDGKDWTTNLQLPGKGEALTYKIKVNFIANQVGVAPIVKVGTTEYTCNFVTEDLQDCRV